MKQERCKMGSRQRGSVLAMKRDIKRGGVWTVGGGNEGIRIEFCCSALRAAAAVCLCAAYL